MAALVPTLASLAANPQVRRYAKQAGKWAFNTVGRRMTKRIQRRRGRRGRKILFPGLFGVPPPGVGRKVTSNVPARRNVSTGATSLPERVCDGELTTLNIPVSTTSDAFVQAAMITPNLPQMWPKLYQKSRTFAHYNVNSLRFLYQPTSGTAVNGTLWFAFTPNLDLSETDIGTSQDIEALPVHYSVSVSQPAEFIIPISVMNRQGKDFIRDDDAAEGGDQSLYMPGQLFFGTTDVTADVETVGNLRVQYVMTLTQPQADTKPTSAVLEFDAALDVDVTRHGEFQVAPVAGQPTEFTISTSRYFFLITVSNQDVSPAISSTGTTHAPLSLAHLGRTLDTHAQIVNMYKCWPSRNATYTCTNTMRALIFRCDAADSSLFDW